MNVVKKLKDEIYNIPLQPRNSKLIVKRDEIKKVGSLYIPETNISIKETVTGIVVAIGKACEDSKLGEKVFFGKYAGTKIEGFDGYLLMDEADVLADFVEVN